MELGKAKLEMSSLRVTRDRGEEELETLWAKLAKAKDDSLLALEEHWLCYEDQEAKSLGALPALLKQEHKWVWTLSKKTCRASLTPLGCVIS